MKGDEFSPTKNNNAITSTPNSQSKFKLAKKKKRDLRRTLFSKDDGLFEEVRDNVKKMEVKVNHQGDEISFSKLQKKRE
jgi:hypothetical protein